MSDEMDGPIFDEWNVSDLELEDVGSEEVEVAIVEEMWGEEGQEAGVEVGEAPLW